MRKILNSVKGFAMSELLVVSVAILFIFSILFSNYLPLVAEYENRISYNNVTSQYAAHYIRKIYKNSIAAGIISEETLKETIEQNGYYALAESGGGARICDIAVQEEKDLCNKIVRGYEITNVIITNYDLTQLKSKTNPPLKEYINYLPTYSRTNTFEEDDETFRIILKTRNYGYATTSIFVNKNDISKPNHPVLAPDMIPVYYDESKNSWIKAEESNENENHPWYNYDEKMWANAVTVYDTSKVNKETETKSGLINLTSGNGSVSQGCKVLYDNLKGEAVFNYNNQTATIAGTAVGFENVYPVSDEWLSAYENAANGNDKCNKINNFQTLGDLSFQSYYKKESMMIDALYDFDKEANFFYALEGSKYTLYRLEPKEMNGEEFIFDIYEVTTETIYSEPGQYTLAKNYEKISSNGISKFKLTNTKKQTLTQTAVNDGYKYICTNLTSTECETLYEINEISDYKIKTVYKLTYTSSSLEKLTYKDGHTENCSGICKKEDYLNADPGVLIPMDDIKTMYVWIPRYRYKVWNYNLNGSVGKSEQMITITFQKGTSSYANITCSDQISTSEASSISEVCTEKTNGECTNNNCNYKTYNHPAFTMDGKEYTGIWVGKFENVTLTNETIIKPNQLRREPGGVLNYLNKIANIESDSTLKTLKKPHMIKNMEWGAVAYLSHSAYGKCDKENKVCSGIEKNSYYKNSNGGLYMTGCGPKTIGDEKYYEGECNSYDTAIGMASSTTGNIYGIYDMNGGNHEYTAASISTTLTSSDLKGFGIPYFDKYSYGTSATGANARSRSKLGDGIKEVYYKSGNTETGNSWYGDQSQVVISSAPWFARGGYSLGEEGTGIFSSLAAIQGAANGADYTTRTVLAIEDNSN